MTGDPDAVATEPALLRGLRRMHLLGAGEVPRMLTPLTGGVSSDILLVATERRRFVVKRALARLRVQADWRAPVERNAYEVAWMREAAAVVPQAVPAILGHDPGLGLFAMAYLEPAAHPVWKSELHAGRAEPAFAAAVGAALCAIHRTTAGRPDVAARFATDAIFHSIRLEPYLEATARRHPRVAEPLMDLSRRTLATRTALVHGDVSPKNILCGPGGPVFLDAECAWYGDPAFDAAFCLNHMLLKCLWTPASAPAFLACFDALAGAYLGGVDWEPPHDVEARIAALLPGLLLARIDGKSPVEYVTDAADKDRVRSVALPLIAAPPATPATVRAAWEQGLGLEIHRS